MPPRRTVPSTRIDELGRWGKSAVLVFIRGKTLVRLVKQVPLSQITSNWLTRYGCCATTGRRGNIITPWSAGIAGWMRFKVHVSRSSCDILTEIGRASCRERGYVTVEG